MDTEITEIAPPSPAPSPAPTAAYEHCGECGAAVDHDQRYCVSCGAHRRHVVDPAARYLGQSHTGTAGALIRTGSPRHRSRWTAGLAHALLLAVIPVALAVGVAVGRSSNNGDASLIRALSGTHAQASTSGSANAASASAAIRARDKRGSRHRKSKHSSAAGQASLAHTKAPSNVNGTPSAAEKQQGKAIVDKLQHTTGTSFLNQLPSQVSVP